MRDISRLNHLLDQATAIKSKLQPNLDRAEKSVKKFETVFQSALQAKPVEQVVAAVKQTAQAEKNSVLQSGLAFNPVVHLPVSTSAAISPVATVASVAAPLPPQSAVSAIAASNAVTASHTVMTAPPSAPVITQNGVQHAATLQDAFDMQKALVAKGMDADQAQSAVSQTLGIDVVKPDFSNYKPDYTLVKSAGYINTPSGWVVDPNYNPGT